jgi:hypothetical protein
LLGAYQTSDSIEKIANNFKDRPVRIGNNTHIAAPIKKSLSGFFSFVIEWDSNGIDDGATIRTSDPSVAREAIVCTNHYVKRRSGETGRSGNSGMRFELLGRQLREQKLILRKQ